MTAAPWMPLYPRDYLGDTTHLTRDEDGGYFLLLMAMWLRGGSLPDDDRQLAHITKCGSKSEWKKLRATLENFFEIADGFWRQKRLSEEYERQQKQYDARSEAARSTNAKRWGERRGERQQSDLPFSPNPSIPPQPQPDKPPLYPPRRRGGKIETLFEGFYEAARSEPRGNGRAHREVASPPLDRHRTGRGPEGDC